MENNGDLMNSKGATGFGLTLIADFIDTYFKNRVQLELFQSLSQMLLKEIL